MTLWQDPPPQSRRQARENERAAAQQAENAGRSRRAATIAPTAAGEVPDVSTPYGSTAAMRGGAGPTAPAVVRPVPPRYDGLAFDTLVSADPAPSDLYRAAQPPGRTEPVTSPLAVVNPPVVPVPAVPASAVPASAVPASAVPASTPEHTLTRRELRAMLQAQEANQQASSPSSAAQNLPSPAATIQAAPIQAAPTPVAPPVAPEPSVIPIAALPVPTTQTVFPQPVSPQPAAPQPVARVQPAVPAPVTQAPAAEVPAADYAPVATPTATAEVTVTTHHAASAPRPYAPTNEPWSLAAAEGSTAGDPAAPSYSRSAVTTGSVTTSNALIIPTVPSAADALGPLTSTGEILVTGSIDLPRSLAATGQHSDRMDTSAIDRLFEQPEAGEHTPSSVAPIRASRAVSSHTSTRDVITPPRNRGNKLPTFLAITAAVLALGVVGLLVAGYVFKVF